MSFELTAWSLLPPLAAIALAISTRKVIVALSAGVFLGATLLAGGNPVLGLGEAVLSVLRVAADPSNTLLLLFCLLIGPLVLSIERFRGVDGFVAWLEARGLVRGPRGARMLAWIIGIVVFIAFLLVFPRYFSDNTPSAAPVGVCTFFVLFLMATCAE